MLSKVALELKQRPDGRRAFPEPNQVKVEWESRAGAEENSSRQGGQSYLHGFLGEHVVFLIYGTVSAKGGFGDSMFSQVSELTHKLQNSLKL
ncbi:unnamed protein product [Strongylus vulgaris]|uniref:Uncharacterized protein n=1 Tax=Strongylus vulgaris TaxID=40348 RepID=A0A3P7IMX2_STRVU|nr:unnamed protein product [Strongylus vulgaris]